MIKIMSFFIPIFLFLIGSLVFVSNYKHLLITLLSLEYMVLSLFFLLFILLSILNLELYFTMIFITFSVCEGALGLSILVSMIRTHGNNYMQSFNLLLC
nr:NADH dehydrogenase subunit 4L [Epicypta sp. WQY003]